MEYKTVYCEVCDYTYDPETTRCYCKRTPQISVGKTYDAEPKQYKEIWNAAIEAAAKEYEENTPGNIDIRKLKK